MSNFASDLRTYILAESKISSIVSTRLFPHQVEQEVAGIGSCLVYKLSLPSPSKDVSFINEPHYETELEVHCIARNYSESIGLASLVRQRLDCFYGTIGGTTVKWITFNDSSDDMELEPLNYIRSLSFTIYTKEEPNYLSS